MSGERQRKGLRVPAKASLWYIISGAVAKGVGALGTPLFTRLLTPEEYGLYPLFNTWLAVLSVIVTLELTGSVIYKGLIRFERRKDEFISATLGLISLIFAVVCILNFAFGAKIREITGLSSTVSWLLLLQIYINATLSLYTAKARYEYKYKGVALLNILISVASLLISVLIIKLFNINAEARIIGMLIVTFSISAPIFFSILKKSKRFFSFEIWKYLLRFNLPLLPHFLSMSVILRVGEITIGRALGQTELGKYSVALSLGLSLSVITGGILSALSPWLMRKIKSQSYGEIRSLLHLVTYTLCIMTLAALTVYPEVLAILTPEEYHDALGAIYPLALSVIPVFLSNAVMSGEMYFEKSAISALPSIMTAVITALSSFLLIPRTTYTVSGVITLASYTTLALLNGKVFERLSGKMPYSPKRIVLALLLSGVYALVIYYFKENILLRLLLSLPLLPLLIILSVRVYKKVKEI